MLVKMEFSDLKVRFMSSVLLAVRFHEKDTGPNEIGKIWCQRLEKKALVLKIVG